MDPEPLTVVAGVLTTVAGAFAMGLSGQARKYCFALTAVFAITTCVAGAAWAREGDGATPPSPTASASRKYETPTPTNPTPVPIRIDPVREVPLCARFTGSGDVPVDQTLWLTVLTDEKKYYFFEVSVNAKRHQWTASNVTLGEPTENEGEPFEIHAVLTDDSATKLIRSGEFIDGTSKLPDSSSWEDQISVERNANNEPCD